MLTKLHQDVLGVVVGFVWDDAGALLALARVLPIVSRGLLQLDERVPCAAIKAVFAEHALLGARHVHLPPLGRLDAAACRAAE